VRGSQVTELLRSGVKQTRLGFQQESSSLGERKLPSPSQVPPLSHCLLLQPRGCQGWFDQFASSSGPALGRFDQRYVHSIHRTSVHTHTRAFSRVCSSTAHSSLGVTFLCLRYVPLTGVREDAGAARAESVLFGDRDRELFIGNLLVRIHFIIKMI